MSNNPPAAILELNEKQAEFLLRNCDMNIQYALSVMMADTLSRPALEKLVDLNEQFKAIREMLIAQGVKNA